MKRQYVRYPGPCGNIIHEAAEDSYKRLLKPSIENEFAALSKEKADEEAIKVFVENLRQLLLSAPLGQKRVLGVDPGFRTGCKTVCLDEQGNLLHHEAIFPHPPKSMTFQAAKAVEEMLRNITLKLSQSVTERQAGRQGSSSTVAWQRRRLRTARTLRCLL